MHIIAVLSQKGGAGKTTIAVNLAVYAALQGASVAILDIDPQASASSWADLRESDEPVTISLPSTRLGKALESAADNGADLVIIDSAPSSESATIAAARAADFVIVPCRASIFDVKAIVSTLDLCAAVKANIGIVLNAVKSKSLDLEARKAITQFDYPVAPVTLWDRVDYVRSLLDGQGVAEYDAGGKAANEIRQLYRWMNQCTTWKVNGVVLPETIM
jgi:chromosome partitioning protein